MQLYYKVIRAIFIQVFIDPSRFLLTQNFKVKECWSSYFFIQKSFRFSSPMLQDWSEKHSQNWKLSIAVQCFPFYTKDTTISMHQGRVKFHYLFLMMTFVRNWLFGNLLTNSKFGYQVKPDIPISPVKYFNQRLLDYDQRFASNQDCIFCKSIIEWYNIWSFINIAMHKVKKTYCWGS